MRAGRKMLWAAVAVAGALAVVSAADAKGFRRYLRLKGEVSSLEDRNRSLAEGNEALLRDIDALRGDPKALERVAREELGFVRPGEVVINLE